MASQNEVLYLRVPSKVKKDFEKKCLKLGCSQAFIVRRMIEEWLAGDLYKSGGCDTFVLNK